MNRRERRAYARDFARGKRYRRWLAMNSTATHCQYRAGKGVCGGTLYRTTDDDGHDIIICPRCIRKHRGICRDCPFPVDGAVGYALRCADCTARARSLSVKQFTARHRDRVAAAERRRMAEWKADGDPRYTARLEYKHLWRALHPDDVREHKRRSYRKHHARVLAYHAARREGERAARRARENARNAGTLPPRACLTCPTIVSGRAKKCRACRQGKFRAALEVLAGRVQSYRVPGAYGPWPSYEYFRNAETVSTPQNKRPARPPSQAPALQTG